MDDYDVFNEMKNIKPIIIGIDKDNSFFWSEQINNHLFEFMPIRLGYNLSEYDKNYIEQTKELFIYYYNDKNTYTNELLKLKKHFKHYQRFPEIAFIPSLETYHELKSMLQELGIRVVNTQKEILDYIKNIVG